MIFVIKSCSRNKQLPPLLTVAGQITNINLNVTPTIIDCKLSLVIDNEWTCIFTDLSDFLDLKTASKMLLMLGSHEIPSKMLLTLGSHKTPSKMLLTLVSHKIPQSVRNLPPPPLQSPGVKVLISI